MIPFINGSDALAIYERNWRFVDPQAFTSEERALLEMLIAEHGNGVLLV